MMDTKIFDSFVLGLLLSISRFLFTGFVVRKGLILCVSVYQMISVIIRICVFAKWCKTWYRLVCGNDCCEGPVVDLLDYCIYVVIQGDCIYCLYVNIVCLWKTCNGAKGTDSILAINSIYSTVPICCSHSQSHSRV